MTERINSENPELLEKELEKQIEGGTVSEAVKTAIKIGRKLNDEEINAFIERFSKEGYHR